MSPLNDPDCVRALCKPNKPVLGEICIFGFNFLWTFVRKSFCQNYLTCAIITRLFYLPESPYRRCQIHKSNICILNNRITTTAHYRDSSHHRATSAGHHIADGGPWGGHCRFKKSVKRKDVHNRLYQFINSINYNNKLRLSDSRKRTGHSRLARAGYHIQGVTTSSSHRRPNTNGASPSTSGYALCSIDWVGSESAFWKKIRLECCVLPRLRVVSWTPIRRLYGILHRAPRPRLESRMATPTRTPLASRPEGGPLQATPARPARPPQGPAAPACAFGGLAEV